MLCANLDALGLHYLADVEEAGKILRRGIILVRVVLDQGVAFVVFLVSQHHRRKETSAVLGLRKALHGAHLRKGLKTVLGNKTCLLYTSDAADEEDSVD